MNFPRKDNGLNQYRAWWPYSIINYDDDVGGDWGAPQEANGVLMQDGWITAGFNALNQPISIWSPMYGTNYLWLGYDPLGRCVKRWVGPTVDDHAPPANSNPATYYYYDGSNMIQEGPSNGPASRVYVHGGRVDEIVASQAGSVWSHHHYDGQGNCIMLTDTNGGIREQYDYDAFGMPYFYTATGDKVGAPQQWGNRFLFTGREWLKDLKLYDYRARLYQPELGRFLQPDPKQFEAGDYNLYRYCHNDPVNHADPFGLAPVIIPDDADSAARAAGVIVNAITQKDPPGFRVEAGKTIFRNPDRTFSMSNKTVRSGADQKIHGFPKPEVPGQKPKIEVHSHVVESVDGKTGANTSAADVRRADFTGKPIYTNAPNGRGGVIQERYRPSDAKTIQERQKEGGVLERLRNNKWEPTGK